MKANNLEFLSFRENKTILLYIFMLNLGKPCHIRGIPFPSRRRTG